MDSMHAYTDVQAPVAETQRASPPSPGALAPGSLPPEALRGLQQRSDREGSLRFAGHMVAIGVVGTLYGWSLEGGGPLVLSLALGIGFGFTLVTMFAAMHECVHRTAFKTRWLNDAVAWFAGLLSFYNSTFYRHYHGWHHRFTQLSGKDPELEDKKPNNVGNYMVELSGVTWWIGKFQTHARIALGHTTSYGFLNDETRPKVVRSVRLQLAVYAAGVVVSFALGEPLLVLYWLLPVALGQPLLRAILLAEHTGCSEDDDVLANTRTTHTVLPVRFLMWEMPYHAEHHRYPALPFFALAKAHASMGPSLVHVARTGYIGFNAALLRRLLRGGPK
jgi:fatty acid desaturase